MTTREEFENVYNYTVESVLSHDWENEDFYAVWSAQTYYYVRHSTRLFAAAASRCPLDRNDIHNRFLSHLNEESGHENLSLVDIKNMKYKISELPELAATQALYETQYYSIDRAHPFSFFGYLLALEGIAVKAGPEIYKRVLAAHGERSSRFLKVHVEEDVDHLSEAFEWFDKFDGQKQEMIFKNFKLSCDLYCKMVTDSQMHLSQKAGNKKAA